LGFRPSRACSSETVGSVCAWTNVVRFGTCPRAPSSAPGLAMHFARSELRPWGLEPTVPPALPVDRTGHAPVRQRPCSRWVSRSPARRSPAPPSCRRRLSPPPTSPARRVARAPSRRRPSPVASLHPHAATRARASWTSQVLCCSVHQSAGPLRGRPALMGFCPSSKTLGV